MFCSTHVMMENSTSLHRISFSYRSTCHYHHHIALLSERVCPFVYFYTTYYCLEFSVYRFCLFWFHQRPKIPWRGCIDRATEIIFHFDSKLVLYPLVACAIVVFYYLGCVLVLPVWSPGHSKESLGFIVYQSGYSRCSWAWQRHILISRWERRKGMKRLRGVSERHFVFEVGVEEQNEWTWEGTVRRLGCGERIYKNQTVQRLYIL